ncbi:MAG: oligosaccharide flippase family protein [Hespellia sp.]|nr:oligosaccharide flippase family protein [Hespellia sp.]
MKIISTDKQVKIGAVLSYVSIVISVLSGMIYTPWMIKCIGQSDYGLFTLANSLISLFIVDFGLSNAVSRFLSVYYSKHQEEKANDMLGLVYKLYLLIDVIILIVLVVLYFFIGKIYTTLTVMELQKFKLVFIVLGLYTLANFPFITLNGILYAREKFIQIRLFDIMSRLLIVALMLILLELGYGLYAVVFVNVGVGLLFIVLKLLLIKRTKLAKPNLKFFDSALLKDIFKFSIWVTVSLLAQRLIFSIVPSILAITLGTAAISVFGIASTIENYTYSIVTAINGFFMPSVARLYANDENADIQPLMTKIGRYNFAVFGIIFAGFLVFGKSFIQIWVGNDYADSYYILCLILFSELFGSAFSIGNIALTVKNRVKEQALITLVSGIINVFLVFVCTKYVGVIGAGISIAIARIISLIIILLLFKRLLGMRYRSFFFDVYFKHSIPLVIIVAEGFILQRFIACSSWSRLILLTAIVFVSYLIFIFLFSLSSSEKKSILNYMKKMKRKKT